MDFNLTLESGKQVERAFVKKMLDTYPNIEKVEFAPDKQFKDWDVKITFYGKYFEDTMHIERTYEVKRDFKSQETGNIALEIKCNGEPSGIFASKADFIVYCTAEDEFWFRNRGELLYDLVDIHKFKARGGDGERAEMYIIDKELLPILFRKFKGNECSG